MPATSLSDKTLMPPWSESLPRLRPALLWGECWWCCSCPPGVWPSTGGSPLLEARNWAVASSVSPTRPCRPGQQAFTGDVLCIRHRDSEQVPALCLGFSPKLQTCPASTSTTSPSGWPVVASPQQVTVGAPEVPSPCPTPTTFPSQARACPFSHSLAQAHNLGIILDFSLCLSLSSPAFNPSANPGSSTFKIYQLFEPFPLHPLPISAHAENFFQVAQERVFAGVGSLSSLGFNNLCMRGRGGKGQRGLSPSFFNLSKPQFPYL